MIPPRHQKWLICILSGFTSGLPFFLLVSLLPAWLRSVHLSLTLIGLSGLMLMPYALKVFWSPWLDQINPFHLGRRRGWILVTTVLLFAAFNALGATSGTALLSMSFWILIISVLSASLDTVLDALRREILEDPELGLGSSLHVNAYKMAGLIPGALALILSDHMPWSDVFLMCSLFLIPGIVMGLLLPEPDILHPPSHLAHAFWQPLRDFLDRHGTRHTIYMLCFIMAYKLGDGLATTLATPFYLDLGFSRTSIGLIAKEVGLSASVLGGLLGGLLMLGWPIRRALWIFGVLQSLSIPGFWFLSRMSHPNLLGLASTVGMEAFSVGLGTTALIAYMAQETHRRYSASQFALLTSAAALPRTLVNASSGWLVHHLGWSSFFLLCWLLSIPGLLLIHGLPVHPVKDDG